MLRVGTAGFAYRDWLGPFYPPGTPQTQWLAYYASRFDTVELNVTFYRLPAARTATAWLERTPPGFLFAVKAYRGLTHERETADFAAFAQAVQPLAEAGRLACVLAQFPGSFRPGEAAWDHLGRLREGLNGLPVAVEFRHAAWAAEPVFERLRALGLGFACVDEPRLPGLMPPVAVATAPVAYVRFHGRNAAQWHRHEHAWQRYDYDYSDEELAEWVPKLRELAASAARVLVYFNNTPRAQGVADAEALRALVGEG